MPVAFIQNFDATTTLEQYEAVMAGLQAQGPFPEALLFHAAGLGENGLVVADVWASAADFQDAFMQRLGPLLGEQGITAPTVRSFEGEVRVGEQADVTFMQVVTIPGVSAEQFARLDAKVLGEERLAPAGCVYHIGGELDGDYVILDYWTDQAANGAFLANQVGPAAQAEGIPMPAIEAVATHTAINGAAVPQ